jgi:CBS domain-containing protein
MQARDVMTKDVCTAARTTQVDKIAKLLVERSISAVPVIDTENHVVGIVSEGDLFRRSETSTGQRRSWLMELIIDPDTLAREYVKTHGLRAEDIMTRRVVSVTEETALGEIADLFDSRRIKRVPVVRAGKLVGIVSRADLVKAFAETVRKETLLPATANDRAIHETLEKKMRAEKWVDSVYLNVVVREGVVELWGLVTSEEIRHALRVLAESIPGVRSVDNKLALRPAIIQAA